MARKGRLGKRSDIQDARRVATLLNITPAPAGASTPFDPNALLSKSYVVVSLDDDLTDERQLAAGDGLILQDAGAGAALTASVALASPSGLSFVTGDLQVDDSIAGSGLTIASKILAVGAGTLISVAADSVSLANGSAQYQVPVTGATPFTPAWTNLSTFAGGGLVFSSGVFAVGAGAGLTVNADDVALTTPGTLSSTSTNSASGNHTHAVNTTIARSAITITAGSGLTGGGDLSANRTIDVATADTSMTINADSIQVRLAATSGLQVSTGLMIADTVAGAGLTIASKVLAVGAGTLISVAADSVSLANGTAQYQIPVTGASPFTPAYAALSGFAGGGLIFSGGVFAVGAGAGLTVNADDVALTTPGSLSVSSANNASGNHTHAVVSSSNPGAAASLVATDANGAVVVRRLGVATSAPGADYQIRLGGGGATGDLLLIHREPVAGNHELVIRPVDTSNRFAYVRAVPGGPSSGVVSTFQAFLTDWYTDTTNWESVEIAADKTNNVGWMRTNAGGTGTIRELHMSAGGSLSAGVRLLTSGNLRIYNALTSYKNSTDYAGYIYVPLLTPLTSTSWDGDAYSTTAKTLIDLSAVFGAPAGIKAVQMRVSVRDSASDGTVAFRGIILSPNNTADVGLVTSCNGITNDAFARDPSVTVPCNANGDIYYQTVASGAGTLDVDLQIWGYYI